MLQGDKTQEMIRFLLLCWQNARLGALHYDSDMTRARLKYEEEPDGDKISILHNATFCDYNLIHGQLTN